MKRSPLRSAGFSMMEVMIVIFLSGAMLFCVAGLTGQTLRTLRFLQEKSTTMESAGQACQRFASELHEAVSVPTLGSTVSFRKVRPSAAPLVGNSPSDATWQRAYPASRLATISYRLDGEKVLRQVNTEMPLELATSVNGFALSRYPSAPEGAYVIRLAIQEQRRVVVFESVVVCPGVTP